MRPKRPRVVLVGLAVMGALVTFGACGAFSKGPYGRAAIVAYKVERLTFVSDAGQRCEVDAVTYSVIKPGELFHCNWGGSTKSAEKSVTTEAPKTAEDPSGPENASPWWWPFKKKAAGPIKAGTSSKKPS